MPPRSAPRADCRGDSRNARGRAASSLVKSHHVNSVYIIWCVAAPSRAYLLRFKPLSCRRRTLFGDIAMRLSLALALLVSLAPAARADIEIAMVAPMTGSDASHGEQLRDGSLQAVDDLNAKGGV